MFSAIRKRLTYANVALTIALVFAMSGGAYAAGKFLITSTKQIKPSVLSQLKGKAGANGAAGAQGPAGPAGAVGPQGPAGAKGENGASGTNGKDGVSVTSASVPKSSSTCSKQGGAEFTSASGSTTACNGKEGSPWTAGGTLPLGQTETGVWAFGPIEEHTSISYVPVSFAIPLAGSLSGGKVCENLEAGHVAEACHVHYINKENKEVIDSFENGITELTSTQCLGTVTEPAAAPGNLCVYASTEFNMRASSSTILEEINNPENPTVGAGRAGAVIVFHQSGTGKYNGIGTWAVTAG